LSSSPVVNVYGAPLAALQVKLADTLRTALVLKPPDMR
jgi:hypothetical protein